MHLRNLSDYQVGSQNRDEPFPRFRLGLETRKDALHSENNEKRSGPQTLSQIFRRSCERACTGKLDFTDRMPRR